jgi:hypothetical protein
MVETAAKGGKDKKRKNTGVQAQKRKSRRTTSRVMKPGIAVIPAKESVIEDEPTSEALVAVTNGGLFSGISKPRQHDLFGN